jgi:hypothetical protein
VHEYNTKKIAQEKEARKKAVAANAKSRAGAKSVAASKTPSRLEPRKTEASALAAHVPEATAR